MTLTERFYRALLNSIGVMIDDKNSSTLMYGYGEDGAYEPIRIDGKVVILPTRSNLKQEPDFWEGKVSFHPIVEQSFRDESKVFRTLQSLLNWKLINTLAYVAKNLAILASHPKIPKEFNPVQHVLLDALKNADGKTVKQLTEVIDASFIGDKSKRLISTAIKQGGRYKNKQYSAVLITLFSLYNNVNYDNKSIFGVKIKRSMDLEQIASLFKFILPHSEIEGGEEYNFGSNSNTAPRLDAMLQGYIKVAERLNALMHIYGEFIEGIEDEIIDTQWSDYLSQLDELKHNIPILEDNFGDINDSAPDDEGDSGKKISTALNINEPNSADDVPQKAHYTNPIRSKFLSSQNTDGNKTMNNDFMKQMQQMQQMQMMQQMMGNNGSNNNSGTKNKKGNNAMNNNPMLQMIEQQLMMKVMSGGTMDMTTMQTLQMLKNEQTQQWAAMSVMQNEDADPLLKQYAMAVSMGGNGMMMNPMMGMGNLFGNNNGDNSNPMMQQMQQMQMMQMMNNMMGGNGGDNSNPMMQQMQQMQMMQMMSNMFGQQTANGDTVTPEQPEPKKSK